MSAINKTRHVIYVALDFQVGLTDLLLTIRKPNGTLVFSTMTEQGNGIYITSYVPDMVGTWQEQIISETNGDIVVRSIEIESSDISDIKNAVDIVSTKVDSVDTKTSTIITKVDAVKAVIDEVKIIVETLKVKKGGNFA